MRRRLLSAAGALVLLFLDATTAVQAYSLRGNAAVEYRLFTESALDPRQHDADAAVALQPEFYHAWDEGRQALTFVPFYRRDQHDDERSHADLRELFWLYVGHNIEWAVGWRKLFWGVTESQHLVDIVNQTDYVEDLDGEEKLGQPMISMNLLARVGLLELYLLPGFRERTFPGEQGRPRSQPRIDTTLPALYEDDAGDDHVDWALRWSRTLGYWDIGVSHFSGTGREPLYLPALSAAGETVLRPYYQLIEQTGVDIQATLNSWLWKLEMIRRSSAAELFGAATAGFEYTVYGALGTVSDVGLVVEYLYDSRDAAAAFSDDWMLGLRLSPNDIAGTQMLVGVIVDAGTAGRFYSLEASRRLTDHVRADLEGRFFTGLDIGDPLYGLRNDDFVELRFSYYF